LIEQSTTLQLWLDRLHDGEPLAVNGLIQHSQERLRLLTRQMLGNFPGVHNWEDTSDVLQGALCRLATALDDPDVRHRMRLPRDLIRFFARLIQRQLIDLTRSLYGRDGIGKNQLPPGRFDFLGNGVLPQSDDQSRLAAWEELHRYIAEDLTDEDRELWDLLYYQGLTRQRAADLLGVHLSTLKRKWQRLRIQIRTELGDDWPF